MPANKQPEPSNALCPCHSHKPYAQCCASYHLGAIPPTALLLMRSRYSAYALGLVDYILATTHPKHAEANTPPAQRKKQIQDFSENTRFKGLEILNFEEALPFSTVTFKATLIQKGRDASFTEKSEFAQIDGRWLYLRPLELSHIKTI